MANALSSESAYRSLVRAAGRLVRELLRRGLSTSAVRFDIALLPNAAMRRLKKEYLKKDVPIVDVLAFPSTHFPMPDDPRRYIGEVYINRDIACNDSARAKFLLIHAVLHLLGYRHAKKHDIIVMEALERDLYHTLFRTAWDNSSSSDSTLERHPSR